MGKNDKKSPDGRAEKSAVGTFTKENLIKSKRFAPMTDALKVCLRDGADYTESEAEKELANFMKGRV